MSSITQLSAIYNITNLMSITQLRIYIKFVRKFKFDLHNIHYWRGVKNFECG